MTHKAYFAMKAVTMMPKTHLGEFRNRPRLQLKAYIRFIMITMNTSDLNVNEVRNFEQHTVHCDPINVGTPHMELIPYET